MTDMNAIVRQATGRMPAEQPRDAGGRFAGREPSSSFGGATAPSRDRTPSMNDLIRGMAGRYTGPTPRATSGIQID